MDAITRNMSSSDAKAYEATPSTLRTAWNAYLIATEEYDTLESITSVDATDDSIEACMNALDQCEHSWYSLVDTFAFVSIGIDVNATTTVTHGFEPRSIATIAVSAAIMMYCDNDNGPYRVNSQLHSGLAGREFIEAYYRTMYILSTCYPRSTFNEVINHALALLDNVNPTLVTCGQ